MGRYLFALVLDFFASSDPAGHWWASAPESEWPEDNDEIIKIREEFQGKTRFPNGTEPLTIYSPCFDDESKRGAFFSTLKIFIGTLSSACGLLSLNILCLPYALA